MVFSLEVVSVRTGSADWTGVKKKAPGPGAEELYLMGPCSVAEQVVDSRSQRTQVLFLAGVGTSHSF